jgi:hypothetical protein
MSRSEMRAELYGTPLGVRRRMTRRLQKEGENVC